MNKGVLWDPDLSMPGTDITEGSTAAMNPQLAVDPAGVSVIWMDSDSATGGPPFDLGYRRLPHSETTWNPPLDQPGTSLKARI
jgi:hypothetical protein